MKHFDVDVEIEDFKEGNPGPSRRYSIGFILVCAFLLIRF